MDKQDGSQTQRLTNADFRRLLMTPRVSQPSSTPAVANPDGSSTKTPSGAKFESTGSNDKAELRRKKKIFYAKLKKQEENKMAELAEKYRDRAKERRVGSNPDYQSQDPVAVASGYRAVAPDIKSGMDAAERRRQMIQESKFLGGDMEHTHLVKGLDYALLQKVKSEIVAKENEQETEMEQLVSNKPSKEKPKEEDEMQFKTRLGRNVYRVALCENELRRNPLFAPGRMAYIIDLSEDITDTDIPTTLIRSKSDVPSMDDRPTLTTNDIVINKLAQILSYLRTGPKHLKKSKRRDKQAFDDNIYPELPDYEPAQRNHHQKRSEESSNTKKQSSYFNSSKDEEKEIERENHKRNEMGWETLSKATFQRKNQTGLLSRLAAEPTGYAECYPGLDEMHDAIEDSDDEADYTKMDLGNKKGPVGRWDFDTAEEYGTYMSNKEVLPKAAFQYGVKMTDGRRTRKHNKEKNEKAELDREWNKIQNIIQKRKVPTAGKEEGSSFKVPKY
ncbi:protein Red [Daktulosphaira vitifoliae]|uniref:protein Red n=1 Tax=Daktulosphaira vitifoliae TaxID=58002 RepID=UPI0021AA6330|nr:protein Red [Daktulosphaira vitifoliae]